LKLSCFIILLCVCSFAQAQHFGEPSFVRSVYFGGGSSYVDYRQTDKILEFLDSVPNVHNYVITVHSHTDNIGGKDYNEFLSEMRSESVIEILLIDGDVKKGSIETKDFGLFNPVYDNSTGYGRRMNRRVDIILWLAI
jgi:outer membrane protein OmpA-like peptidoglycan-associated protein